MAAVAITDVVKLYICKPCRACGKKPDIHLDDGESGPWVSFDDPSVECMENHFLWTVCRKDFPYNYIMLTSQRRSHSCSVVTEV